MSATPAGNIQRDSVGNLVGYAGSGGRRGLKAKTLKRMMKKAGLKCSGKKSTLTKRAKKAHLIRGGYLLGMSHIQNTPQPGGVSGGRRTRRRRRHH